MNNSLGEKLGSFFGLRAPKEPPDNFGKVRVYCIKCKKNYGLRYPEFAEKEKTWWECNDCLREKAMATYKRSKRG